VTERYGDRAKEGSEGGREDGRDMEGESEGERRIMGDPKSQKFATTKIIFFF